MPYIQQSSRLIVDPLIEKLEPFCAWSDPGMLNYIITKLLLQAGAKRYAQHSALRGMLADVSSEYYRRVMVPYEDYKMAENGDAYTGYGS